jgi:hypothetical protein
MFVSEAKRTNREIIENAINTELLQDEQVSQEEDARNVHITIGDVTFSVQYSWSYNLGRFGSQAKSYVELNVVSGFYDECDDIGFRRKNKVNIEKAQKDVSLVIAKAEKLAEELLKSREGFRRRQEARDNRAEQVKAVFEAKGHTVEDIHAKSGYGSVTVYTPDYKYVVSFDNETVKVKSKESRSWEGFELETI